MDWDLKKVVLIDALLGFCGLLALVLAYRLDARGARFWSRCFRSAGVQLGLLLVFWRLWVVLSIELAAWLSK